MAPSTPGAPERTFTQEELDAAYSAGFRDALADAALKCSAVQWLADVLREPTPKAVIEARGRRDGYSASTLRRARVELGAAFEWRGRRMFWLPPVGNWSTGHNLDGVGVAL